MYVSIVCCEPPTCRTLTHHFSHLPSHLRACFMKPVKPLWQTSHWYILNLLLLVCLKLCASASRKHTHKKNTHIQYTHMYNSIGQDISPWWDLFPPANTMRKKTHNKNIMDHTHTCTAIYISLEKNSKYTYLWFNVQGWVSLGVVLGRSDLPLVRDYIPCT